MHLLSTADSRLCSRNHGPIGQALCNSELISAPKFGEKPDSAAQPRPPQVSRGPALVLQALQVSRQKPAGPAVQAYSCRYAPKQPNYHYSSQCNNNQTVGSIGTALSAIILIHALCAAVHIVKSCIQALVESNTRSLYHKCNSKAALVLLHSRYDIPEQNTISQPQVGPQQH